MTASPLPPVADLRQLLAYDPDAGLLRWLPRPVSAFKDSPQKSASHLAAIWNAKWAGKEAFGYVRADGYKYGTLAGRQYLAHRIAWAVHHGVVPESIDHINGDPADNRMANLRDVPFVDNCRNRSRPSNNTSGVVGVHWRESRGAWCAAITTNRKQRALGQFDTREAAEAARLTAQREAGFHENHGR